MARATYLERMMKKFGYLATWLPGQVLSLGSIGVLDGGEFILKTSLDALKIGFKALQGQANLDFEHQHGAAVSFAASAGAGAVTGTRATASLKFGSGEGFVFRARDCVEQVIGDMADVEEEIFELVRQKIWKEEWVVVNRLVCAACSTIIVTEGSAAEVQIEGSGAGPFDLADASLGLRVAGKSGDVTTLVAASSLTPLYQATRIQSSWWGGPKARKVRSFGDDEMVPVSLADAVASKPAEG